MLSDNFQFQGFSSASWLRLLSLLGYKPHRHKAPVLAIIEGNERQAVAAFTTAGDIIPVSEYLGRDCLPALCNRYGAHKAIAVRQGVLERIVIDASFRMPQDGDLLDQLLPILTGVRDATLRGDLAFHPESGTFPIPTANMVRRAVDHILPNDHAMVVAVWERRELWTALVLRRRGKKIDLCAGPDALLGWVGALGGDYRRDHRIISRAIDHEVAPVHLGLYAQRAQLEQLLRNPDPGSWLKAVALREIVFDPTPAYVNAALAADAARAATERAREVLGGLDLLHRLQPYAGALRDQLGSISSVTRLLGFNPLHQLATLLRGR